MILSHRSRRVSNLRKKSPDGHCLTGAFLYWNQWAGLFGHKGIESLGFRGHLTLDFPLVTSADHIPVVYHKYDIDCKTGEATHTKREAELQDLTIHGQLQALQHREQDELKAALRKYGTEVDGGFEVHFEGEQPIVAGYLFDEPRDIVIDAARLDADGNLSLLGEDKEVRDGQYDIEPSDIFGGQLDYVTSSIGAWMK